MFINRLIHRAKLARDRAKIRTSPLGVSNQTGCALVLARQLVEEAEKKGKPTGELLYAYLPPDQAPVLIGVWFDPYTLNLTFSQIVDWLWDHVIFDNNAYIIALHDRGEILSREEVWEKDTEWFSRVRLADGDKWEIVRDENWSSSG